MLLSVILSLISCVTTKHDEIKSRSISKVSDTESIYYENQPTLSSVALNDNDAEIRKLALKLLK